jgi:hypothetical protein
MVYMKLFYQCYLFIVLLFSYFCQGFKIDFGDIVNKRNSRQENSSKRGREHSLIRQSYGQNQNLRPGSGHLGRSGIPDTFTPPCRTHSSKKNKRGNFKINSSQGFYTHKLPSKL